jgi:WASH complex subunit 7, N-terminal
MTPDPWDGYFENTATATSKRPIDGEVQKTLTFVQRHDEQLQSDLESCSLYGDCGTFSRPIRIALDPTERVAVLDILTPDETNESLQKAVVVFVFLCDEVHELKEIAEEKFYAPLIMFGRPPVDESGESEYTVLADDREFVLPACHIHCCSTVEDVFQSYS